LERWYGALGQRVIVQISSADPGGDELDRFLAARGYEIEAPVQVMVRDLRPGADRAAGERARTPSGAPSLNVQVTDGIDGAWAHRYAEAHGGDEVARKRTYAYGRMLEAIGDRVLAASATVDGQPAGVGLGVLDEGWLGIFGMGTGAAHRRRGVAAAVATALLERAAARRATGAYLQVETANTPALRLYAALGFTPSHRYHYRVSAPA
jgi:ribosomal protein S18 acetylase RimI-like enzyme